MEKKEKLIHRLRHKYRLVILNDETFEEKVSFKLSRMNVFVFSSFSVVFLISSTIILIAFTPLREYIPGYSSTELRQQAIRLATKADSLETQLGYYDKHLENIQNIILGNPLSTETQVELDSGIKKPESIDLNPSVKEDVLRQFVEEEDQFNLPTYDKALSHFSFFTPVNGVVTSPFNLAENHLAVDVAAKKNTAVKSCLAGTVLMASWTSETGYVLIIQHTQDLISVYKHNSALLKEQGDFVRTGEAVAIIGNSGDQTTGPHLHFELWHKGNPVDPQNFIAFLK